jgi:adenylate cyclase
MRDHVDRLLAKAERTGKPGLATRFGINTGEVMVGNIGASERFNYGILGDAVNTAARLEVLNKAYGTRMLLGERTAELVGGEMVIRLVDWVRMKGKRKRMVVYELVGTPDEVDEATRAAIDRYTESLRAYREGRFEEAAAGFREVDEALGGDGPSQVLLKRCEAYFAQPPPEAWDGVHVMTQK